MRWSIGDFLIAWVSDSSSNTQTGGFHVIARVGLLAEALEHLTHAAQAETDYRTGGEGRQKKNY
jgi:hypothetical protein